MVVYTESKPTRGPRRIRSLVLGGNWRTSWRSSTQTLESREESTCTQNVVDEAGLPPIPRHVHFPEDSEELESVILLPAEASSEEEFKRRWFQSDDYVRFEKDRVLTSFGYLSSRRIGGANFDGKVHCIRGLENMTDTRRIKREAGDRKALVQAVRGEEERQRKEGIFPDMKKFKSVSQRLTKGSINRAMSVAQLDAREVRLFSKSSSTIAPSSPTGRSRKKLGGTVRRASIS
eukprot:Nitzschia sp. Nitz4//scaffold156_size52432//49959//50733//NITZ4_006834-RA/size52432-snap-gene-0.14-mRNA-1//-1//CDS//3329537436//1799//frame0